MKQVRDQVNNQVMKQVKNQVRNQVRNQVIDQVRDQVSNQVMKQVRDKIYKIWWVIRIGRDVLGLYNEHLGTPSQFTNLRNPRGK